MRAIITGITGQDGSYLAEMLLEKGYSVIGISRTKQYIYNINHIINDINFIEADISDSSAMTKLISDNKPDEFYNLAAISHIEDCWNNPITNIRVNCEAPISIINSILNTSPDTKFLQATSREIFGNTSEIMTEISNISTENPYAVAKLYVHMMIDSYRKNKNLFACSAILFNHESPRRQDKFFTKKVTNFVKNITGEKNPNKLYLGDLDTKRDWGYAPDFVKGMWLMLQQNNPEDFLFCTERLTSLKEFLSIAFKIKNLNWEDWVDYDPNLVRKTEILSPKGTYKKALEVLKWKPETKLEDMIEEMIND